MNPDVSVSGPAHGAGFCNGCNTPHAIGVFVVRLRSLEFRICPDCRDLVVAGLGVARTRIGQPAAQCSAVVFVPEQLRRTGRGATGFERHYTHRQCKRPAAIGCYCRQHARTAIAP